MASQEFKNAIKGQTRQTSAQVTFELLDTTASQDATISATDKEAEVSRETEINNARDYNIMKFTTLENNYFALNGSSHLTPKNTENIAVQVGYLSDSISGADGVFTTPPSITFNFTTSHSSIGLSMEFDDEYPTSMTIIYYDASNNVLSNETITNNKKLRVYGKAVQNYRKIEIFFNSTRNPYRRVRLYSMIFGIIQQYTDDELLEFNLTRETSLMTDNTIPVSECSFKIDNLNRDFNIINPSGVYDFLQTKQMISTKMGVYLPDGTVEYVNSGNYYLNDWKSEGATATLVANDKLSFSTTLYTTASATKTLKQWAVAILTAIGYTEYEIDDSLDNISVTTQFDNMDCKELLKYIAQVSNTMMYVDTNDKVVFKAMPVTKEDEIGFDNMYKEPTITLDTQCNQVDVKVWVYNTPVESQTSVSVHNWIAGDEVFVKEIKGNPFVTTNAIATNVGNNALNLLNNRLLYEIDWRQDPAIDINTIVEVEDGFNEDKNIIITKQEYKYAGYLQGRTEGRGYIINE